MGGLLTVVEYMQNDEPGGDSEELPERRSQGLAGGGDAQCVPCRSGATVSLCGVSAEPLRRNPLLMRVSFSRFFRLLPRLECEHGATSSPFYHNRD